jgi:hypothetical protein
VPEETRERWKVLCEEVMRETDTDRLIALVKEINRLLAEKDTRLREDENAPLLFRDKLDSTE